MIVPSSPGSTSTPETKDLVFWGSAQGHLLFLLFSWSGTEHVRDHTAAPHLCQPAAEAGSLRARPWWPQASGAARGGGGLWPTLAQASISKEGTLAHPHPKVITATSFWFLSCSEGKMCGLGCGRGQEDSEGPAGQGWCHRVSQAITWITKASIS